MEAHLRPPEVALLPLLLATLSVAGSCQTTRPDSRPDSRPASRPDPGPSPREAAAPQEATARSDQAKVVHRILERCHNTIRGTMDNAFLELRKAGTETTDKALLGKGPQSRPVYLRITHPDGSTSILNGRHAGLYRRGDGGRYARVKLSAAQEKRLRDLNALLRAALLRPLYDAERVDHQGAGVYRLVLKGGETWRLEVDAETGLPRSLTGPPGKVAFEEHKATGVTFLPKVVTLGALGRHRINLIDSGLAFNKPYFQDPESPLRRFKEIRKVAAPAGEPRRPRLERLPGRMSLVLADPGNWKERIDVLGPHQRELYGQGQMGTDLLYFYEEAGKRCMAIPFAPDEERGSQPFVRRKHQKVAHRPPQLVAVVVVKGSEKEAAARGSKVLGKFLRQQKLEATGPLRVIPYVLPENGVPDAGKLEKLKVRLELPVARKAKR